MEFQEPKKNNVLYSFRVLTSVVSINTDECVNLHKMIHFPPSLMTLTAPPTPCCAGTTRGNITD